ncbi:nuclear transcription factor Y subunit gamma-like [Pectinophora gossypiella]|uniref:Nuclear transcription factor Y subunit gamma n=1 Tax=Pectinophora gossypiella TaxID=13191 RepID=A0A1E1WQI7_PECGO|nr:nuclear transcription factor Y subunit gamma-like [Pectinophora gossypiella]
MSVCFYVPADQAGNNAEEVEQEGAEEVSQVDDTQHTLEQFWQNVTEDIKKVNAEDFKTQALPLARIKKIMKLDEEVKMISAEAPVMFAKAAEIFIHELTLRAWQHTEDNKRRTLQRNDIAMAISKSDQFDFLIDIVPRHEVKPTKPREEPPRATTSSDQYCVQLSQQQPMSSSAQPQFIIQPTQIVQQQQSSSQASSSGSVVPQPVALVQQLVSGGDGGVQQLPIQLTQAQLNMIRLQVQNNPSQPIIIQTQHQSPQIIQVTSQAQHQPQQQQVFLAQVANSQEES